MDARGADAEGLGLRAEERCRVKGGDGPASPSCSIAALWPAESRLCIYSTLTRGCLSVCLSELPGPAIANHHKLSGFKL